MRLPRDGQEYAHLLFSELPFNVPVEASVDGRLTWHPTTSGDSADERQFLVRGPSSTATEGALVATSGDLWVRVVDSPETVVRLAGQITLY